MHLVVAIDAFAHAEIALAAPSADVSLAQVDCPHGFPLSAARTRLA